MTYCFEPGYVVELNASLTRAPAVVLDQNKLESALARPLHTFDGVFLHGTVLEQGAALLDGLCQAHAFIDGNKRTAWMCSLLYMDSHGITIADTPATEAAAFVEGVVLHEFDVKSAAVWFADRIG